jgi:hypothetical protein
MPCQLVDGRPGLSGRGAGDAVFPAESKLQEQPGRSGREDTGSRGQELRYSPFRVPSHPHARTPGDCHSLRDWAPLAGMHFDAICDRSHRLMTALSSPLNWQGSSAFPMESAQSSLPRTRGSRAGTGLRAMGSGARIQSGELHAWQITVPRAFPPGPGARVHLPHSLQSLQYFPSMHL